MRHDDADALREEMKKRWEGQQVAASEVAKALGITEGQAYYHMTRAGIARKRVGMPAGHPRTKANAVLTLGKAREIRTRSAAGEKAIDLARDYDVSRQAIYLVIRGQSWPEPKVG